ncbi:MAG: phosphotransferase family protein [Chloroflexota bacterium]
MSTPPTLPDAVLRRAPSREALATMAAAIRPGSQVGAIRRLRGGVSSGMHAVQLRGPGTEQQWVVVRRYGAWRLQHDPHVAERERATLAALARVGAPAPLPIWLDASGAVFGCQTLVTSRVPGRGLLAPRDLDGWVRQLAEALARIHAAPLHTDELSLLIDQRDAPARLLERAEPPDFLVERRLGSEVWYALHERWPRIAPVRQPAIVHGDFWPGNTLFRYGKLSAVVDWEQVVRGDPAQDVACCRLDLTLLSGMPAADAFLDAYLAVSGRALHDLAFWELYQSTWAIETLEEWVKGYADLGRTDLTSTVAHARLERFVAGAMARAAMTDRPSQTEPDPSSEHVAGG